MTRLYIGLMSGTSIDGIDASLVEFNNKQINLLAFDYFPFSDAIKKEIQQLSLPDASVRLIDYGATDSHLGCLFAQAANTLLEKAKIPSSKITAIGSHGQTVYHSPDRSFSLQIGDPNIIAEMTGITTVTDFRRRDIAAGGQGAPLVPAFHQAIFSQTFDLSKQHISIINIGGIANISYLSNNKTIGFDIGPGNALIDFWTQKHLNTGYDKNGAWARTGTVNTDLVTSLKQDPYFKLTPPKSTGKEYFSPPWLNEKINHFPNCTPKDIQASLCQFTAETISEAIHHYTPLTEQVLICGGGVHNQYLVELISDNLMLPVTSTEEFGINPDHVEAMAFAWLARQTLCNLPGNLTEVTGAKTPVILGGIYPGKNGLNRK
jgi:anhydro-N-acetylmuramic acid kinase